MRRSAAARSPSAVRRSAAARSSWGLDLLRTGAEGHLVRDPGLPTAFEVDGPGILGQVELPVDQYTVATTVGVGQERPDLTIIDTSEGTGILPLDPADLMQAWTGRRLGQQKMAIQSGSGRATG